MSAAANVWNEDRLVPHGRESALSDRANAVYGWLAGLYAFVVPWSDMILLPYQVQFSRPLAILAVLCLLFSWRAGNTLRRTGFPIGAMALFIMLVPIHLLSAPDPERTGRRLLSYLGLFFMTLFLQQCVRTWKAHLSTLSCYIAGCCVLLANLGWNVLSGNVQGDGRYGGSGVDPNDLAGQIALSVPIAAYLAFTLRRGAIFGLYLPLAVLGVLLTASRAGLVTLLIASLYPLICLMRRMKRGRLGLIAALLITGWSIGALAPNISFRRLATVGDEISRGDLNGRGAVWASGLQLYWENPVLGIGAGAFAGAVRGGSSRLAAHNTYLEILVEHGAAGLGLFLAIIAGLFLRAWRYPPEERLLWWIVLGAWMVLILTLSWENREYTWLIWGLCSSFLPRQSHQAGGRLRAA